MEKFFLLIPKHFTKKKIFSISIALILSIISLFGLITVRPLFETAELKPIGVLLDKKNQVNRQHDGSLSFYGIKKNEIIYHDDEIFTDENSFATVKFYNSKNQVVLLPNTLVKIQELNKGDAVNIKSGNLKFHLMMHQELKVSNNESSLILSNLAKEESSTSIGLNSGKITLNSDNNNIAVKIKDNTFEKIILKKNQSVSLENNKLLNTPTLKVISPQPDERVSNVLPIKLEWVSRERVEIIVSKNDDFSNPIFETITDIDQSSLVLPKILEEGDYFVKFFCKTLDQNVQLKIRARKEYFLDLIYPLDKAKILLNRNNDKIVLSWEKLNSSEYKIYIKEKNNIEKEFITNSNDFTLPLSLTNSEIEWRVSAKMINGEFAPPSVSRSFTIQFGGTNNLISPLASARHYYLEDNEIYFKWESSPSEIFDVSFFDMLSTTPFLTKTIKASEFYFPMDKTGQFKMLLHSSTYPMLKDVAFNFNIYQQVAIAQSVLPVSLDSNMLEKKLKFDFKISEEFLKNAYLEVSSSVNFYKILEKIKLNSPSILYQIKKLGTFCFRVSSQTDNPFIVSSKPQCTMIGNQFQVNIQKPKDINIRRSLLGKLDDCIFEAPFFSTASEYEFKVFSDPLMKNEVFSGKSTNNKLVWFNDDVGIIDYRRANTFGGTYYYNYRIFGKYKNKSSFSPVATISLPTPITSIFLFVLVSFIIIYALFRLIVNKIYKKT